MQRTAASTWHARMALPSPRCIRYGGPVPAAAPLSRAFAARRLHGQQHSRAVSSEARGPQRPTSSSSTALHQTRRYASTQLEKQPAPQQQQDSPVRQEAARNSNDGYGGAFSGPAMHTLGVATRMFRISVYASVGIITTAAALYLSLHAYVEYIALHGASRIPVQDDGESSYSILLPEEHIPAFSGAHRGGGTDPTLSWRARGAARAAWMALNLASGEAAAGGASTVRDVAVPDGTWLAAERYLKFALKEIDKLNAAKPESTEKRKAGYRELKMQLAILQSKLGGPRGLREARANLSELLRTMPELGHLSRTESARWLELQRILADVTFQLASEDKSGAGPTRQKQALDQLEASMMLALTGHTMQEASIPPVVTEAPVQPTSPGFSIRNFWAKTPDVTGDAVMPTVPVSGAEPIVHALQAAERPLAPVAKRVITRMLMDDVSMSARLRQLSRAEAVCNASLNYIRSAMGALTSLQPEERLYKTSLGVQAVFLQSYLAELLAARQSAPQLVSLTSTSDVNTRNILNEAVESARGLLGELDNLDKAPGFSGRALQGAYTTVMSSAQRAASLAHSTRAVIAEVQDKDYLSALQDYEAAHTLANAMKSSDTDYSTMYSRTLEGIRRCREKLAK